MSKFKINKTKLTSLYKRVKDSMDNPMIKLVAESASYDYLIMRTIEELNNIQNGRTTSNNESIETAIRLLGLAWLRNSQ